MKKKTSPSKTKTSTKPVLVCLLLDRSGSMASCQAETISGFNAYLKALKENQPGTTRFTLTQFDSQGIDRVHDAVPLGSVNPLNDRNYQPRGGTPLFDAMGKTINAAKAKAGSRYKVLFVSQTDGDENSSHEWTLSTINQLIKDREADGWTFAHIGTGIQGWAQGGRMYAGTCSASNVMHTRGAKMGQSLGVVLAEATLNYSASVASDTATMKTLFDGKEDQTK
jgi:uncharacterized protein YegL